MWVLGTISEGRWRLGKDQEVSQNWTNERGRKGGEEKKGGDRGQREIESVHSLLAEVVKTLGGEGVVVVLPRELGLDEALGGEGLHSLDDLEVADLGEVRVRGGVEVLGGDHDTLCKKHEELAVRTLRLHEFDVWP